MDNLVFLPEITENSKSVDKVHLHFDDTGTGQ